MQKRTNDSSIRRIQPWSAFIIDFAARISDFPKKTDSACPNSGDRIIKIYAVDSLYLPERYAKYLL